MIPFDALEKKIEGDLYSDMFRRHMLATDGSIFKQLPRAVAYPKNTDDVVEIVKFATEYHLSVHARGTGSGVCGAALGRGIVVDFTKYMNRLVRLDIGGRQFECQPGYRMGELSEALNGSNLFFPPDPSSGEYASFGGMYATNASGSRSVKYGNVGDYCVDAQIVTAGGEVVTLAGLTNLSEKGLFAPFNQLYRLYRENEDLIENAYPKVRYNSSGYNLRGMVTEYGHLNLGALFAGAEGTLGLVTRLTFRLEPVKPHDILVIAYFDNITLSARATQEILPLNPNSVEVMDKSLLDLGRQTDAELDRLLPRGLDNLLLIAFDEDGEDVCRNKATKVEKLLRDNGYSDQIHIAFSREEKDRFWSIRKAAVPILYRMKGDKKVLALIEDATVPTDQLVPYFKGIYEILDSLEVRFVLFGHISKGLLHTRPMLDLKQTQDTQLLKTISDRIFDLVHSLGGAISGEHGDGRLRSVYIRRQYPAIFHLFERVKDLLDPEHMFNPDILTGAPEEGTSGDYRFASLRYGPAYRADNPYDPIMMGQGMMTREIEKCHGCSKCTTVTHATRMCPVYKVLRDEAAAPKAKANILRNLISGNFERDLPVSPGTADETDFVLRNAYAQGIFHVLDHCIACGSCSHECPSQVDIPGLAMEARANFKQRFGISLSEHILTSVALNARLARPFSKLADTAMQMPFLRQVMEKATGISSRRAIDAFSREPLTPCSHPHTGRKKGRVIYFAGCYATHIKPEISRAAVSVLTAMGFDVEIPEQGCCGIPMFSKGMADKARTFVAKNMAVWGQRVASAELVVTACSSCLYAMLNYWEKVLGGTAGGLDALQRKATHISTLACRYMDRLDLTPADTRVAYHTPCHFKATPHAGDSIQMLSRIPGLEISAMNTHCCGMAGTWGMLAKNYELSGKIGSDLKAKMEMSDAGIAATDCPTCRMQMASFALQPVVHPVEILARSLALR